MKRRTTDDSVHAFYHRKKFTPLLERTRVMPSLGNTLRYSIAIKASLTVPFRKLCGQTRYQLTLPKRFWNRVNHFAMEMSRTAHTMRDPSCRLFRHHFLWTILDLSLYCEPQTSRYHHASSYLALCLARRRSSSIATAFFRLRFTQSAALTTSSSPSLTSPRVSPCGMRNTRWQRYFLRPGQSVPTSS